MRPNRHMSGLVHACRQADDHFSNPLISNAQGTVLAPETRVRRRLGNYVPVVATALLTAAVFLLPATADRRQAQAAIDGIKVSATLINPHGAKERPVAYE